MHHVTGKLARVGDAVVVLLRRRMGGRRGGGFRTAVGLPASLVRLLRLSPVVHLCPSSRARLILCAGCGPQARATIAISWACAPLGSKTPTRYMVISRGRCRLCPIGGTRCHGYYSPERGCSRNLPRRCFWHRRLVPAQACPTGSTRQAGSGATARPVPTRAVAPPPTRRKRRTTATRPISQAFRPNQRRPRRRTNSNRSQIL